jgi:hypothetical protein
MKLTEKYIKRRWKGTKKLKMTIKPNQDQKLKTRLVKLVDTSGLKSNFLYYFLKKRYLINVNDYLN